MKRGLKAPLRYDRNVLMVIVDLPGIRAFITRYH